MGASCYMRRFIDGRVSVILSSPSCHRKLSLSALLIPPDLTQNVVTIKNPNAVDGPPGMMTAKLSQNGSCGADSFQNGALRVQLPTSNTYMSIDNKMGSPPASGCAGGGTVDSKSSRPSSALYHELSIGRSPVFGNFIPANLDPEAVSWGTITSAGGRLVLPESGKRNG